MSNEIRMTDELSIELIQQAAQFPHAGSQLARAVRHIAARLRGIEQREDDVVVPNQLWEQTNAQALSWKSRAEAAEAELARLRGDGAQPEQQGEAVAWMADDGTGRVIGAKAKDAGTRAAATGSATRVYSIPLVRGDAVKAPPTGNWINADDVHRLVRELDVALNGEEGAAKQAMLVDVVGQAKRHARLHGPVFGQPEVYVDFPHSIGTAGPFPVRDGRITLTAETVADLLARQRVAAPAPVAGDAVSITISEEQRFEDWCRRNEYDVAKRLDGSGYNNYATYRAWRAWMAALAQDRASQPEAAPGVPEGWALVPERMTLTPRDIQNLLTAVDLDSEADDVDDRYATGILVVGTLNEETDDEHVHGLHIYSAEYPDEGCTTLVEFAAAPKPTAGEKGHG